MGLRQRLDLVGKALQGLAKCCHPPRLSDKIADLVFGEPVSAFVAVD
jgi:hypothetical protein